jgi:hypothetical protein
MSVRLRHPSLQDVNFNVVHYRRYRAPFYCANCREIHTLKTYHLRLDSHGEVVVSDVIYERLAELDGLPLRKVGKAKPKPMRLVLPPAGAEVPMEQTESTLYVPKGLREVV